MEITDITPTDLQDETKGPINIEERRKEVTKRMKDDKYLRKIAIYNSSVFRDFASFLGTEVDLVDDDIRLVLAE